MATQAIPVIFIHGLWLHASAWEPWLERFRAAGYEPHAPVWPGEAPTATECRAHPEAMADLKLQDVTDHFAALLRAYDEPPVVVGHSFGGLIAQKLLADRRCAAAVAIDPAPLRGVLSVPVVQLRSLWPVLRNPSNRHRAVSLTREQFRYAFANAVSPEESDVLFERYAIPGSGRMLFEGALANVSPRSAAKVATDDAHRGPLLIIGGGQDNVVPEIVSRAAHRLHARSLAVTEYHVFFDRGHSLVIDSGWREVADLVLDWLLEQGLSPSLRGTAPAETAHAPP